MTDIEVLNARRDAYAEGFNNGRKHQRAANRALLIGMLEALSNLENDNGYIPPSAWEMVQEAIRDAKGSRL